MVLDREGFVKGHEVYEGNKLDIKTLEDGVKKLKDKVGDMNKGLTIIIDRG